MKSTALKTGSTIGIFGGGQLGRMLSQAATKLGFKTHIYDVFENTPAGRASEYRTAAQYDDLAAIQIFAKSCDVITYEFENIPSAALKEAAKHAPIFPSAHALDISHDRLVEKAYLRDIANVPIIDFFKIETMEELAQALDAFNGPCVLKTRRFGYDGKGQVKVDGPKNIKSGFASLGGADLIAEKFAPFVREFSIIAARDQQGNIACYPMTENVHKDHRLHTSFAPATDPQNVSEQAHAITHSILNALEYVGVMGVEFFEMEGGGLIVNEIAPRVHNSGHWTQDAGCTDQFEQHIRAVTGLPLGDPSPKHTVLMTNLIGDEITHAEHLSQNPKTYAHDYDKQDIRPGRKMGHVNVVID